MFTRSSTNRRRAGKLAQASGKGFEVIFKTACRRIGVSVVEIPDGCRVYGRGKMFRTKTPFDMILEFEGKAAVIDCKTFEHNSLTFSDIKLHQLEAIKALTQNGAVIGGYVVYFREINQIRFFTGSQLSSLVARHSLDPSLGIVLGGIESLDPRPLFRASV